MVYVTHDQLEAMSLGHRIAILNKGRLEQVGTPLEVYDRPATLVLRALHRLPADEPPDGRDRRGRPAGAGRPGPPPPDGLARGRTLVAGVRPEALEVTGRARTPRSRRGSSPRRRSATR